MARKTVQRGCLTGENRPKNTEKVENLEVRGFNIGKREKPMVLPGKIMVFLCCFLFFFYDPWGPSSQVATVKQSRKDHNEVKDMFSFSKKKQGRHDGMICGCL